MGTQIECCRRPQGLGKKDLKIYRGIQRKNINNMNPSSEFDDPDTFGTYKFPSQNKNTQVKSNLYSHINNNNVKSTFPKFSELNIEPIGDPTPPNHQKTPNPPQIISQKQLPIQSYTAQYPIKQKENIIPNQYSHQSNTYNNVLPPKYINSQQNEYIQPKSQLNKYMQPKSQLNEYIQPKTQLNEYIQPKQNNFYIENIPNNLEYQNSGNEQQNYYKSQPMTETNNIQYLPPQVQNIPQSNDYFLSTNDDSNTINYMQPQTQTMENIYTNHQIQYNEDNNNEYMNSIPKTEEVQQYSNIENNYYEEPQQVKNEFNSYEQQQPNYTNNEVYNNFDVKVLPTKYLQTTTRPIQYVGQDLEKKNINYYKEMKNENISFHQPLHDGPKDNENKHQNIYDRRNDSKNINNNFMSKKLEGNQPIGQKGDENEHEIIYDARNDSKNIDNFMNQKVEGKSNMRNSRRLIKEDNSDNNFNFENKYNKGIDNIPEEGSELEDEFMKNDIEKEREEIFKNAKVLRMGTVEKKKESQFCEVPDFLSKFFSKVFC